MPQTTNFGKAAALPPGPEYHHWSKEFIKEHVGRDEQLTAYLSYNSSYQVNANMLALYQFQKEPLLGKFKTVVIDCQEGIVLSKRSSRSLINELLKTQLLAGLAFQKEIARRLNYKAHYVLATGRLAYFSTHGYLAGDTDWLSLHQMVDYQVGPARALHFKSTQLNGINYTFSFTDCGRYIKKKVSDSLYYNYVVYQLVSSQFEHWGWQLQKQPPQSLLDQRDYYLPHRRRAFFTLRELWHDLLKHKYIKYGQNLAETFALQLVKEDHYFVYRLSKRDDNLF